MGFARRSVSFSLVFILVMVMVFAALQQSVFALVGPHSYTHPSNGDVFLGGDYIEVGISKYGSFGTTSGQPLPSGFYGTAARTNVGMSTNPTGFGVSPDLRMDYFLPGTPEERWAVGYKVSGTPTIGSNAFLRGTTDISNYTVTNQSSGNELKASGSGTFNSVLETTQIVSFDRADKFFKNQVTLKNVSGSSIDSVRFMRSFDPDNTRDQGGSHPTQNQIVYTHAAGDGKAVVMSDTTNNPSDPVYLVNGSRSPILFYTSDSRARVSTFGFANADPYAAQAYDSALAKGTSNAADAGITITVDVGTLAPGASQTFVYYTSLDNRDFSQVLEDIAADESGPVDDGDGIDVTVEQNAPNNGDGNGDGIPDSQQPKVTSIPNTVVGGGAYQSLETSNCNSIASMAVGAESFYGTDGAYEYPLGLASFSINCATPGETTTIKLYYDKQYDTKNWYARKSKNGSFIDIPGATFGTATVGAKTVTTLTYQVQDGGPLDADGSANGVIVDPAGPATLNGKGAAATPGSPNTGLPRANDAPQEILAYVLMVTGVTVFIRYAYLVDGKKQR